MVIVILSYLRQRKDKFGEFGYSMSKIASDEFHI
jgi:hypothetical protein